MINGRSGQTAVYGASGLMALCIVAITVIVSMGEPIPSIIESLLTLLGGFLVGTRVVTPSVARQIKGNDAGEEARGG